MFKNPPRLFGFFFINFHLFLLSNTPRTDYYFISKPPEEAGGGGGTDRRSTERTVGAESAACGNSVETQCRGFVGSRNASSVTEFWGICAHNYI